MSNLKVSVLKEQIESISNIFDEPYDFALEVCKLLKSLKFKYYSSGSFSLVFKRYSFPYIVKVSPLTFNELAEYTPLPDVPLLNKHFLKPTLLLKGVIIQRRAKVSKSLHKEAYKELSNQISHNYLDILDIHALNCGFINNKPVFFDYGLANSLTYDYIIDPEFIERIEEIFGATIL